MLVVDDAHDTRVELRHLLEEEGYSVATACTGREALTFLRSSPQPSVALVDLWMPVMDGAELTRCVRGDQALASLPLILLTALVPDPDVRALADGYLRKPFACDDLLQIVERYTGRAATPDDAA